MFVLIKRRPPRSTRTDTLFPYTTLFRSVVSDQLPMCHITGGGDTDLQPIVEAVIASPEFARHWEAGGDLSKGDMASTRFRRSEEHTSELQSLMRISYAVFCLKKKMIKNQTQHLIILQTQHLKH